MSEIPGLKGVAIELLPSTDTRIVITGASGWIGRATLELLHNVLGPDGFARRVIAFGSTSRVIEFAEGQAIGQRAICKIAELPQAPTLVLHLAFLTKDKVAGMDADEYRRAIRTLREKVLHALDDIGAMAVFVASSGAADLSEEADTSAAMRLYGSQKKDDEEAFACWASERGRRAVIARIFALSGPHINKHNNYALACFIKDALAGRAINIRADFPVYRSYVAIRELMSVVFASMLENEPGVVRFSTGGERLEMQRIAEIISATLGPVEIDRPPLRSGKADDYVGDDVTYRQLLSKYSIEHIPFSQQVMETAAFFASDRNPTGIVEHPSHRRVGAVPKLANKRNIA